MSVRRAESSVASPWGPRPDRRAAPAQSISVQPITGAVAPVRDHPTAGIGAPAPEPDDSQSRERASPPSALAHGSLIIVALCAWSWSVARVDEHMLGELGLITVLPISMFVAIAALLVGYSTIVRRWTRSSLHAAYVVAATVMLHGLPVFAYDHLRFSWAWKHIGITDYIIRNGSVDRSVDSLQVYHNWPGFFGLNAAVTEASGLESALSYAAWAPLLFNLAFVATLYVLYRSLTDDRRLIWAAIMLFELANWVGQDYFAPQALAFFLYLVVIAILLRWFPHERQLASWSASGRDTSHVATRGSVEAKVLSGVVAGGLFVIAVSHQLTPIMTLLGLAALVFGRLIRVRWPLIVTVVFTAAWMFGFAATFVVDHLAVALGDVGGVQANVETSLIDYSSVSTAQVITSLVARGLSASVVGLAVVGFLRSRRVAASWRSAVLLALAPVSLVVLSSYGSEIIFRAYLFALPFLAYLGGALWFPAVDAGRRVIATISFALVTLLLGTAFLVAEFGADQRQVFTDGEIAAATYVYETGRSGSILIEGSRDYPTHFSNYENFFHVPIDRGWPSTIDRVMADPPGRLAMWMSDPQYTDAFILITRSQKDSVDFLGTLPDPGLEGIERALLGSEKFAVAFETGDARVFVLAPP